MFSISSLLPNPINFFNHDDKPQVAEKVNTLTHSLRAGDNIRVLHTPFVLPLGTSNEIGGYARSLGFSLGPKLIALDCHRLSEESPAMQEFILARQVALFDKSSRCFHLPIAAIVVAIAAVASSIVFPASILATVGIVGMTALASGTVIAERERKNEQYADLIAFQHATDPCKENILQSFKEKQEEEVNTRRSFIKDIFSGYPSYRERYNQLVENSQIDEESTITI